jgi:UDP-sugar transporter A1/2/3
VIKYADNIVKTYATAVSIVLTCIAAAAIERALPTAGFAQGMLLVLASMFLYNKKPKTK